MSDVLGADKVAQILRSQLDCAVPAELMHCCRTAQPTAPLKRGNRTDKETQRALYDGET